MVFSADIKTGKGPIPSFLQILLKPTGGVTYDKYGMMARKKVTNISHLKLATLLASPYPAWDFWSAWRELLGTSIFDKVQRTFTRFAQRCHGIARDCKQSTMTFMFFLRGLKTILQYLQVVSLSLVSDSKQHGTENNRTRLSTCSQVIKA